MTAAVTTSQRLLLWIVPLALTVSCAWALRTWLAGNPLALTVLLLEIGLTGLAWYGYLRVPREVSLQGPTLVCAAPAGAASIHIGDIQRINVRGVHRGFVEVSTRRRRIFMLRNMTGLLPILARVAAERPSIVVSGRFPHVAV